MAGGGAHEEPLDGLRIEDGNVVDLIIAGIEDGYRPAGHVESRREAPAQ